MSHAAAAGCGHAATLRLLAARGRVLTRRAAVVSAAALARRGGHTYTLWPDSRQPMISADMAYPPAAEWLRRTLVPTLRRLPDAAGWMALRARAALVGERPGLAVEVGGRLVDDATSLRVAMYSPAGQAVSKAVCFLFAEGDAEPRLVVKAMAEPRFSGRLRRETTLLESVRERVADDRHVAAGLPPRPLLARNTGGEFVLAEPFDPVAVATGVEARELALGWLRGLHAASCSREQQWDWEDERAALDEARDTWRLAGLRTDRLIWRLQELLAPLRGLALPRGAVHGDFWRGNVAASEGSLRVYDWEWCRLDGTPLFDLWTYELAELRIRARKGKPALDEPLRVALERVRHELALRSLDQRFALATLPPIVGHLSFRIRRRLAMPDELETASVAVMSAVERLLLSE